MAISDFHSSADLSEVDFNGLINEDVMQQIWDISNIPLPLSDLIGSDDVDNSYTEWTEDRLNDPNLGNAVAENYNDPSTNDAKSGARIGNACQISIKYVAVTHRARNVDTIGRADELAYQVMMRQRELRRDVEAIALSNQGSVTPASEGDAGKTAGFGAAITQGDRIGTGGGFANGSWTALTAGLKRPLTETMVRDVAQLVWEQGGNPSIFMSTPSVVRAFSNYLFTDNARIAQLTAETNQEVATAMGSVNVFLTDFGVELRMIPNRIQQPYGSSAADPGVTDAASALILDPAYARLGYLQGYMVDEQGKKGLTDERIMSVDWCTKALNREAHGIITDIDPLANVTLT